jgi:hypothetical protein
MNLNPPSMDGSTITDKLKGDRKIPFLLSKIHLKPFIFRMRIDSKRSLDVFRIKIHIENDTLLESI